MASRLLTIHVTREDIAAGGCYGDSCPVNLAARRAFPGYHPLHVTKRSIGLGGSGPGVSLPPEAVDWIARRDDWRAGAAALEPFSFTVTMPELAAATP